MMMELYGQEEVLRSYVKSERYGVAKETAKRLLYMGS